MRSIACISSTVAKSFIPIGVTRMRSSAFSSSTSAGQSYSFGSSTAISSMLMTLIAYPSCFRLVHAEARGSGLSRANGAGVAEVGNGDEHTETPRSRAGRLRVRPSVECYLLDGTISVWPVQIT